MKRVLLALLLIAAGAQAAVKIEKTNFRGWPNCYRITNGEVELVVTTDVGPRVIRYAFVGGKNIFKEFDAEMGKTGENKWMPRGGHRIWFAPEDAKLTYPADNFSVKADLQGDAILLTGPVEPDSGLQKTIRVKLAATGSAVEVTHTIKNTRAKAFPLAAWALTMMAPGGVGMTGFPPRGTHPQVLAPTNPLVMWAFTDFSDKRWIFMKKYLGLKQDPQAKAPQKTGLFNANTWAAYLLGDNLFIKRTSADPKKPYADFGCSFETFSSNEFLELETLGPLVTLKQNDSVSHIERWSLHKNIQIPSFTDEALDKTVLPLVGR